MTNTLWQPLVTQALLGTIARPFESLPTDATPLGKAVGAIQAPTPEGAILKAAALVSPFQQQQSGWIKRFNGKFEVFTAVEDLPEAPPVAARLLEAILRETHYYWQLPHWLRAGEGYRIPDHLLVPFLNYVAGHIMDFITIPPIPDITLFLGARGQWLAQQRPMWYFAAWRSDFEGVWKRFSIKPYFGTVLLSWLHDDDPQAARQFIQRLATERRPLLYLEQYIGTLQFGLSDEDEPFLESLLDNRTGPHNEYAANLLAQLPQSAFVQRMIQRARARLWVERSSDGKGKLIYVVEDVLAKDMQRDTLARRVLNLSDKGGVAYRTLSCVPPRVWLEHLNLTPDELIALAAQEKPIFFNALEAAAYRNHDLAIVTGILKVRCQGRLVGRPLTGNLLAILTDAEREQVFHEIWRWVPKDNHNRHYDGMAGVRWNWSAAYSRDMLPIYQQYMTHYPEARTVLMLMKYHMGQIHPSTIPALVALLNAYHPTDYIDDLRGEILATLQPTYAIYEAFGATTHDE